MTIITHRWRVLAMICLTTVALLGCQKNVPVEEDPTQQQQAVAVMKLYIENLFVKQDVGILKARTALPFWVNSQRFDNIEGMVADLKKSELGKVTNLTVSITEAELVSPEKLQADHAKLWGKLVKRDLVGEGHYAFKVKVVFEAEEFGRDKDDGWVIMIRDQSGQWQVHGLQ